MKKMMFQRIHMIVFCVCSVFVMMLFAACSGVASTGSSTSSTPGSNSTTVTGTVQSVNTSAHSVTLSVTLNGQTQQYTISGLSDAQLASLQANKGKTYSIQVTQNGNSYSINQGTDPQANNGAAQGVATTTTSNGVSGANEPGSFDFIGKVQSMNASNVVVSMPSGDTLTANITAQTDRSDFNNAQVAQGQYVKIKALADTANGGFAAAKLGLVDSKDVQDSTKLNTVDFTGVTTSAVGSDSTVHFNVGNKSYNFAIGPNTQLKDFASAQAIGSNQSVQVEVLFNGATGSVVKVSNGSN